MDVRHDHFGLGAEAITRGPEMGTEADFVVHEISENAQSAKEHLADVGGFDDLRTDLVSLHLLLCFVCPQHVFMSACCADFGQKGALEALGTKEGRLTERSKKNQIAEARKGEGRSVDSSQERKTATTGKENEELEEGETLTKRA